MQIDVKIGKVSDELIKKLKVYENTLKYSITKEGHNIKVHVVYNKYDLPLDFIITTEEIMKVKDPYYFVCSVMNYIWYKIEKRINGKN